MRYRKEIDGLRALSVLSVILFHAGFTSFSGGFVGVDIFFVLSGYLISSLLLQELRTSGSINFVAFYARRLRRLLPGLVLMLLFGSIIGAAVLAPYEQIPQAQAAGSAFLWLSNFHFSIADFKANRRQQHLEKLGGSNYFERFFPFFTPPLASTRRHSFCSNAELLAFKLFPKTWSHIFCHCDGTSLVILSQGL